jgi:hypothetical protein
LRERGDFRNGCGKPVASTLPKTAATALYAVRDTFASQIASSCSTPQTAFVHAGHERISFAGARDASRAQALGCAAIDRAMTYRAGEKQHGRLQVCGVFMRVNTYETRMKTRTPQNLPAHADRHADMHIRALRRL